MKLHPLLVVCLALLTVPGLAAPPEPEPVAAPLHTVDPQTPQDLQTLFRHSTGSLPMVTAHRGGARPLFPENCIATFEHTLRHTFAALEIDPRYTKDGTIVLHHDATLERTTTGRGRVEDFTVAELKELRLKDTVGKVTKFQIPTLDEVLEWARGKTILILDQKDVPVAARVRKIEEHHAEAYAMLIVYNFKDAQTCHAMNPNIMMEVMIPDQARFEAFGKAGVPWNNIVAFVGHTPPKDAAIFELIHGKEARCIVGTSRNLDRKLLATEPPAVESLEPDYRALRQQGADLLETDLPVQVGRLLHHDSPPPPSIKRFFHRP